MFLNAFVRRVCLVHEMVDFRCGHDGLLGAAYRLGLSPYDGDLVVFVGRRKDRIKLLAADPSGLWVAYKRLHSGTVSRDFKFLEDRSISTIPPSTVTKLLEGTKFETPVTGPEKKMI
jgi:hypothetical protein